MSYFNTGPNQNDCTDIYCFYTINILPIIGRRLMLEKQYYSSYVANANMFVLLSSGWVTAGEELNFAVQFHHGFVLKYG